ncbi:small fragment nuclease [Myripristis murdjan]|uniref:Oligoribonuclease, mitochondrial n=1 Tax=Myripristis murdjan TaxID=586833 RepID=A0A667WVB7_9TELE|nr:oligoribonuclease, mitochondrial [Myripristis murdjan]
MPVCVRTAPAWALRAAGFVCRRRQPLLRVSSAQPRRNLFSRDLVQRDAGSTAGSLRDAARTAACVFDASFSRRSGRSMSTGGRSDPAMSQRMVWVDLEMTGLDIEKDHIIEMACIITDSELNILAEGPNLIINQSDELLDGMSDWCKEHHGKSGLTQAVRDSKISLQQAEYEFLSFIRQHTPPGQCPLAGNSVHADKKFLDKYMPQFMYHLHYRIIDVSTIKELCRRWFPEEYKMAPQKKASHRALDDIRESIRELQFYRANVFKSPTQEKKRKIVENGDSSKS